jgi:alcohol dehydrogenase class IV
MLPHVIRFNAVEDSVRRGYAELASAPELACVSDGLEQAVDALVREIEAFLDTAKMPRRLRDCGVAGDKLSLLAAEAARQWTAAFNPRATTAADFEALYEAAF